MTRTQAMEEARAAMIYYTARGWDWLTVVEFICWKARHAPKEKL